MTIAERLRNSWAILPATRVLFNKNKISIREASKEWAEGTILICRKALNNEFLFIYSSGTSDADFQHYKGKIGTAQACHHDQTFSNIGPVIVVNVVNYKQTPMLYAETTALPIDSDNWVESAPLYVFK